MTRRLKFLILSLLIGIILMPLDCRSQTDALLTQYWSLPTYYNPATTGDIDFVRIRGGGRLQWLGIENAPKNFVVAADSPFQIGKRRIGAGASVSQESIGLFSNMLLNLQGSYKFKFLKGMLSVGVQGGYYTSKFRGSDVYIPEGDDYHQSSDEALPTRDMTGQSFDFSAGIAYSHKYFNIGISAQHILEPTVHFESEGAETAEMSQYESRLTRSLYLTADGNIGIKNTLIEMQPSMILRTDFKGLDGEVTMRAMYKKLFWLGIGYRLNDAVSIMGGVEIKNFFLGYSYDYSTSAIAKVSSGSHELIVGYKLKLDFSKKNRNKHRSIRLM